MSYNKDFDVIHSQQALLIRNMGSMKDLRIGSHGGKHGRSSSLSNISRNLELSQQEVIFKYLKNKSRSNMISRKTKQGVKRKLKSHSSSKIESKREKKSTKKKQKKKLFFLKQQFKSLKLSENQKMARNNRANHKAYEKSSFLTSVNFLQKKKGSFKKRRGLMTLGNQTPLTKKNSLFTPEATHVGGNKPKSRSKLEEGTLLGDKFNMSESITTNKPSETELGSVIQLNKKYIREALDKQSQNLELRTELFLAHLKTPKKEINSTGYKTEDREEYRRIKRLLSKRHHSGRKAKRLNYQEQREIINKKVDIFDYLPKRTSQIDFILKYENFPFLSSEFFGGYFEKISGNFSMLGSTSISSFLNLNSRKSRTGVENFNNGNFQKKFQTRFDTHEREFKEYMRRYRKNQNPDRDDYTSVITWFDKIYPKIAKPRCRSHKKLTSLKDIPDDSVRHKSQDNSFVDPQTGDHDFHGFSRYLQDYSKILGLLSKEVIDMLTRTSKEASFAVKKIYSESLKLMEITFEFFQKCISGTAKIHSREIKKLQQNYKELLDNKNTMLEERKDIIIRKEVEIEHLKKKCNVLSHKLSNDIIAMRNLRSEISHVNELSNLLKEEKLKVFDIVADLFKSVESFKLKANDTANKHQVGDPATFEELEYKIETIFKIKDDFQDETVFLKQQKRENEKRNLEQNISEKDISHLKNELQRDFDYQYDGYSAKNRCIQVVPNQEYFIDEYSQTVGNIKTRDFCEQVMITTCPKCLQLKKANRESKNQIDDLMYKLSRMDTENKELKKMRTNAFSSEKREIQDSVENISSGTLGEGSLSPDGVARWSRADGSPRRLSDAKKGSPKEGRRRRRRRSKFSKMVSVDRERRRSSLMSRSSRGSSKKKANSPSGGRVKPSQMYRKSLVAVSKDSIVEDNSLDEILSRTSKKSVSGPGNTLEPPTIQVNFQLPETLSRNIDVTMSPTKSRMSDTDIKDIIKKFIGTSLDTLKHQMTGFEQLDPHSQDTFQKELENCQNIFERIDLFERRESRFQNEGFKIVVTQESEMNSDSEGDDAVRPLLQPIRTDSKRRGKLRRSQSEALSMQDLARLGVEPQTPISPLLPSRYSGSPRKQKFSLKASRPSKKFSKTLRRQTTFGFTSHKDREGMLMVNLSKKRFNEMTSLASNTFNETIASLKSEGIDREKVVATKKTMVKKVLGIYKDYADDLKKKEGRQSMVDLHIFAFKMINDKNSNKKIAVKKYQLVSHPYSISHERHFHFLPSFNIMR